VNGDFDFEFWIKVKIQNLQSKIKVTKARRPEGHTNQSQTELK
jgi:hypothetical protein